MYSFPTTDHAAVAQLSDFCASLQLKQKEAKVKADRQELTQQQGSLDSPKGWCSLSLHPD